MSSIDSAPRVDFQSLLSKFAIGEGILCNQLMRYLIQYMCAITRVIREISHKIVS